MDRSLLGMTVKGYVNMSIKQQARAALMQMSLRLSHELGRRVSMSEALEMTIRAARSADQPCPPECGQNWQRASDPIEHVEHCPQRQNDPCA